MVYIKTDQPRDVALMLQSKGIQFLDYPIFIQNGTRYGFTVDKESGNTTISTRKRKWQHRRVIQYEASQRVNELYALEEAVCKHNHKRNRFNRKAVCR